jgi:hypothetical protein
MLITEGLVSGKYKSVAIRKSDGFFEVRTSKDKVLSFYPSHDVLLTDVIVSEKEGVTSFDFFSGKKDINYIRRLFSVKDLLDFDETEECSFRISPWWRFWKKEYTTFTVPSNRRWYNLIIKMPIMVEFRNNGIVFSSDTICWNKRCSEVDLHDLEKLLGEEKV